MKNSRQAERSKRHRQPVFKEACCKHVFTRRDMALRLLKLYRCWCGSAWGDEASNLLGIASVASIFDQFFVFTELIN